MPWHAVAELSDIPEQAGLAVEVGEVTIALFNVEGTIYATQDTCTHADASLAEGYVDGDCVECPLHQATFHIPSGEAREAPAEIDLKTYPVKVEDSVIHVELP